MARLLPAPARPQLYADYTCDLPAMYFIEPTNACNLHCPFCATGSGQNERPKGFMKLADYRLILDKIAPVATFINMFNQGEPLLNREIIPMIELTAAKGITSYLSTNLSLPDLDFEALARSGLSVMRVALDGASRETYGRYRRGGDFDLVLRNIAGIQAAKSRLGLKTPLVVWNYLVNCYNEYEQEAARAMAGELGVQIDFQPMLLYDPEWRSSLHRAGIVSDCVQRTDPAAFARADRSLPIAVEDVLLQPALYNRFCGYVFRAMFVQWNGDVYPCCDVNGPEGKVGNLLTDDLVTIWNGPGYRRCREYLYNYGEKKTPDCVCSSSDCLIRRKNVG
ncbi:MAG: radical SAM protein [Candidatus Margulisiibacteriota bacterium]